MPGWGDALPTLGSTLESVDMGDTGAASVLVGVPPSVDPSVAAPRFPISIPCPPSVLSWSALDPATNLSCVDAGETTTVSSPLLAYAGGGVRPREPKLVVPVPHRRWPRSQLSLGRRKTKNQRAATIRMTATGTMTPMAI